MEPGYEYHVFISYRRSGDVCDWVRNHFHPVLVRRLEAVLDEDPKVFIDDGIEIGSAWPQRLSDALHKSCCMVAVWTPTYFRSDWCQAEWQTVVERERIAGLRTADGRPGVVYPVVYSDGDSFPAEAKAIQSRQDMHDFAYPFEQFRNSNKYEGFFDRMSDIAKAVTTRIRDVPVWDAAWPALRNAPAAAPLAPQFARL